METQKYTTGNFMKKSKVAIIEDEIELLNLITSTCEGLHCRVYSFRTFEDFVFKYSDINPDLIITDLNLPGESGHTLIKNIRKRTNQTPIIMISGAGTPDNVLNAINSGADDFIAKPFDFDIFAAKIKRILNRKNEGSEADSIVAEDIEIKSEERMIIRGEHIIKLTPIEFKIFENLYLNGNSLVLRDELSVEMSGQSLDVHIYTLRRKIKKISLQIETFKNRGYKLVEK